MDTNPCPDCGHDKAMHGSLVGCLTVYPDASGGEGDACECDRSFKEDKPREQMTAERDQAMAQAQVGTDPTWKTEASRVVRELAATGDTFTPDDVWVSLEEQRITPPREPRALGPILKWMTRHEVIRPVGFTESRRRHGAPVRIYEAGAKA